MIKIRKAVKNDINTIYDLIMGIAKYHNQESYVLTDKRELLKAGFDKDAKYGVLIAEFEEQVIGYLSYTWNYSIWTGGDYMNIDDLFVWDKFRGKKGGQYLMEFAKDICKEKGIKLLRWEVEKDNLRAIDFYKRLGAKLTEKGVFRWE